MQKSFRMWHIKKSSHFRTLSDPQPAGGGGQRQRHSAGLQLQRGEHLTLTPGLPRRWRRRRRYWGWRLAFRQEHLRRPTDSCSGDSLRTCLLLKLCEVLNNLLSKRFQDQTIYNSLNILAEVPIVSTQRKKFRKQSFLDTMPYSYMDSMDFWGLSSLKLSIFCKFNLSDFSRFSHRNLKNFFSHLWLWCT
jgi:hypothetical protein